MNNPVAFNSIWENFYNYQSYGKYAWSESLAMAARQFINDREACKISGDYMGNTFEEILTKYYTASYSGLKYSIIEFPDPTDYLDAG